MISIFRRSAIVLILIGIVLAGAAIPPSVARSASLGHWEIVRRVAYDDLPAESLTGDLPPGYGAYPVALAGFHNDSFGISIGPDDDVRATWDGGQTWRRATGDLYCRHGLEIVSDTVAWHCGNGGTRVSVDGGQNWQTVAPSSCPSLSFLDEQTGWAASSYRLQTTTDGGLHWTNVTLPVERQTIVAVALRTARDGYVLSATGDLWVTADGGQSWQARSLGLNPGEHLLATRQGPYTVMRFLDARQGMVVYSRSDQTVWFAITHDGGQSWQRAEITELRNQAVYYHLFLSQDGHLLTVTDSFLKGTNTSLVLRYQEP